MTKAEKDLEKLPEPVYVLLMGENCVPLRTAVFGDTGSAEVQAKSWFRDHPQGVVLLLKPIGKIEAQPIVVSIAYP